MLNTVLSFIIAWYNLPFSLLLALAAVLAMVQLIGLGGEDSDADHDFDSDADVDAEGEADTDTDSDADSEPAFAWLAQLGFGKAPLLIVLLLLFSFIGATGWLVNGIVLRFFDPYPGGAIALALPLALIVGGASGARVALLIGRALPPISSTASCAKSLVGQTGTVISPFVDQHYGQIHLRNPGGTLISIFAVTRFDEPLRRGEAVVLAAYDDIHKRYVVTRAMPEHSPP